MSRTTKGKIDLAEARVVNDFRWGADVQVALQAGLSAVAEGSLRLHPLADPSWPERADQDYVRQWSMSTIEETVEIARELGWKPWKNRRTLAEIGASPAAYNGLAEELADLLIFVGNIVAWLDHHDVVSPGDVAAAYVGKLRENLRRFSGEVEGYEDPTNE